MLRCINFCYILKGRAIGDRPNLLACQRRRMSHGVKRQRESPEKEAARLEKEKAQINDYRALTEDVLTRVIILFEHPWLLASWKWPVQIRIRFDDHAPQEESWILHSMELPPTHPPRRTFQRVFAHCRSGLTKKEILIKYKSCWSQSCNFCSFDSESIRNVTGYGCIGSGV